MGACKVEVDPGVCKLKTTIIAKPSDDMMSVVYDIKSDCPHVTELGSKLGSVNPYTSLEVPINECCVYVQAGKCLPHCACPVPCAIIKATEVASDLGLKRDVTMTISDAE